MDNQDKKTTQNEKTAQDDKKQQTNVQNMDRREGEMNNGELGGNMDQQRDEEKR